MTVETENLQLMMKYYGETGILDKR